MLLPAAPPETVDELYEHAPCGYLTLDTDGQVLRANGTLAGWLGLPRKELLGRTFSELLSPGSRIYYETHFAPLLAMQGSVKAVAMDLLRAAHGPLPVLASATTVRGPGGRPAFVRVNLVDMSDRRDFEDELVLARRSAEAARQRFERLFDSAPDALVLMGVDGLVTLVNAATERLYGRPRASFVGQSLHALLAIPEDEPPPPVHPLASITLGRGPVEMRARVGDGHATPVDVTFSQVESMPPQVIANLRDATDRKAMESERRQAVEQRSELARLESLDRFKTTFINTAAHELRTPLTPIQLQLHLLALGDGLGETQRQAVGVLQRNVQRLATIVEDLLTMASSQAGTLAIDAKPVDLAAVAAEAVQAVAGVAAAKAITLETIPGEPAPVLADPGRIAWVVRSLLGNAFKFTPRGGRVEVAVEDLDDRVRVRITDTGIGLAPESLAQLFAPFAQVHQRRDVTEPGSGLGLYICRQLVGMHGGTIGLESPGEGQGTTAWFVLPKLDGPAPQPSRAG